MLASALPSASTVIAKPQWIRLGGDSLWVESIDYPDAPGSLIAYIPSMRWVYSGMAATPKRARAVEAALIGRPWTMATVEAALPAYEQDFSPISDMRASAEYRMLAAKNLLKRFWLETSGTKAPVTVKRFEEA